LSLGRFTLAFPPAARGLPRVGVQFEIDANGILRVLARDTKTGHQKIVEMNLPSMSPMPPCNRWLRNLSNTPSTT